MKVVMTHFSHNGVISGGGALVLLKARSMGLEGLARGHIRDEHAPQPATIAARL